MEKLVSGKSTPSPNNVRDKESDRNDPRITSKEHNRMEKTKRVQWIGGKIFIRRSRPPIQEVSETKNLIQSQDADRSRIIHRQGNQPTDHERSDIRSKMDTIHYEPDRCGTQKGRETKNDSRPSISELPLSDTQIQIRRNRNIINNDKRIGLDVFSGLRGRIPPHSNESKGENTSWDPMEEQNVCIQRPTFWTSDSSMDFHENNETSNSNYPVTGIPHDSIHGRFSRSPTRKREGSSKNLFSPTDESTGMVPINKKIKSPIRKEKTVSRAISRHDELHTVTKSPSEQKTPNHPRNTKNHKQRKKRSSPSKKSSKDNRTMHSPHSSSRTNENADEKHLQRLSSKNALETRDIPVQSSTVRPRMVDDSNEKMGWPTTDSTSCGTGDGYGRVRLRMGSNSQRKRGIRILDTINEKHIDKPTRTDSSSPRDNVIQGITTRKSSKDTIGQHIDSSIPEQTIRKSRQSLQYGKSHLEHIATTQHPSNIVPTRIGQYKSGLAKQDKGPIRNKRKSIQRNRQEMGKTHDRSDGIMAKPSTPKIQFTPLQPRSRSSELLPRKLERGEQLGEPPLQQNRASSPTRKEMPSDSNSDSSFLASPTMVYNAIGNDDSDSNSPSETQEYFPTRSNRKCGTMEKPKMGRIRVSDFWVKAAEADGWDEATTKLLEFGLKNPKGYDAYARRYLEFCTEKEVEPFPAKSNTVAAFLLQITETSERPESTIKGARASIGTISRGLGFSPPAEDHLLMRFCAGLIRQRTKRPIKSASPPPLKNIIELLTIGQLGKDWKNLDETELRMKTMLLIALTLMLRAGEPAIMKWNQIWIKENLSEGALCLNGFKTDGSGNGEIIPILPCSIEKLCPLKALTIYRARIEKHIAPGNENAVFYSLTNPKFPIKNERCSKVLKQALTLASLPDFPARSLRSLGATRGIQIGIDPDQIMKVGRWKDPRTFYNHYVASRLPTDYTDRFFGVKDLQTLVERMEEPDTSNRDTLQQIDLPENQEIDITLTDDEFDDLSDIQQELDSFWENIETMSTDNLSDTEKKRLRKQTNRFSPSSYGIV